MAIRRSRAADRLPKPILFVSNLIEIGLGSVLDDVFVCAV